MSINKGQMYEAINLEAGHLRYNLQTWSHWNRDLQRKFPRREELSLDYSSGGGKFPPSLYPMHIGMTPVNHARVHVCLISSFVTHEKGYKPRRVADSLLWLVMSQSSYKKYLLLHTVFVQSSHHCLFCPSRAAWSRKWRRQTWSDLSSISKCHQNLNKVFLAKSMIHALKCINEVLCM